MEIEQSESINEKSDDEVVKENEERKKERNREYQRAFRQRKKNLKQKVSKEIKEARKRKRHRENQRAYYQRKKGLKKNVEELFQKKLDDLQMVRLPMVAGMEREGGAAGGGAEAAKGEVGRMVDSSQADDRRLIRLVRERRLLYARNNMPVASYYAQVKALWDDVAARMGWRVADVRRKWSHVRNSYSRHLRNEMHGACTSRGRMVSRWYLADELDFLREHMATDTRPAPYAALAPTMVELDLAEPGAEPVDVKPFLQSPWFRLSPPPAPSDDSLGSTFAPDENTSYFQFFRGIHNDYRELPPRKKRQFKRKCLNFLYELLDAEEPAPFPQHDALNLSGDARDALDARNARDARHARDARDARDDDDDDDDDERDQKPNLSEFILPNK